MDARADTSGRGPAGPVRRIRMGAIGAVVVGAALVSLGGAALPTDPAPAPGAEIRAALTGAGPGALGSWLPPHWAAAGAATLVAVQGAVIGALLVQRRRRQRVEALNGAVLASVAAEVAVVDRGGIVLTANQRWADNAGFIHPLLRTRLGDRLDLQRPSTDDDDPDAAAARRLVAALGAVLEGRSTGADVELGWADDAGRRWAQVLIQPLEGGGAVIAHFDISARKHAEIEVQRALHDVAHVNLLAGLGEMVGSIVHEVNQPLAASLANAQALRREVARQSAAPELAGLADDIIVQNHRAAELLQRLRGTVRRDEFEWRQVDLNALVLDTTRLIVDQAAQRGVRLRVKMAPEAPLVQGDRVQLQQVIVNIVTNAVHAAAGPTGGEGTPAIAGGPGLVRVETRRRADDVELTVTDTGPGIAADALPRLFEPFYTTKPDGLGLGLSISRSIISVHGGRLAASNLARGAQFSLTLPLADLAAPELAGQAADSA
jgi:C4-dicarboxylate-specific signal transduction histidine kinase